MYYILLHKFFRALQSRFCEITNHKITKSHFFFFFTQIFLNFVPSKGQETQRTTQEYRAFTEQLPSLLWKHGSRSLQRRYKRGPPPQEGGKEEPPQKKSRGVPTLFIDL